MLQTAKLFSLPRETLSQVLDHVDVNDVWTMSQVCQVYRWLSFYNVSRRYHLEVGGSDLSALSACLIRSIRRAQTANPAFIDVTPKLVHYIRYHRTGSMDDRVDGIVRIFVQHIVYTHHSYALLCYLQRQLARLHEQHAINKVLQSHLADAVTENAIQSITTFLVTNATTCPEIPLADTFICHIFDSMCDLALRVPPKTRKPLVDTLGRLVFEMPIRGSLGRQMRRRFDQLYEPVRPLNLHPTDM